MAVQLHMHAEHLRHADDLVTPQENLFCERIRFTQERRRIAQPIICRTRDLTERLKRVRNPAGLCRNSGVQGALLTATGVPDIFERPVIERERAVRSFVETHVANAGKDWRRRIVRRFLFAQRQFLHRVSDKIPFRMAKRRFITALWAHLGIGGLDFHIHTEHSCRWIPRSRCRDFFFDTDRVDFMAWRNERGTRILAFNREIPMVEGPVGISLVECETKNRPARVFENPSRFLALGEFDPAGADEHWKTARTALDRIRAGFEKKGHAPALFFVGAAIEQAMASEIWDWLNEGRLDNAANLTVDAHLSALCDWIVGL